MGVLDNLPGFKEASSAFEGSAQPGMTKYPGGQRDALRHALWNAQMAQNYGRPAALIASTGFEGVEQLVNALHPTRSWADRKRVFEEGVMDFKNNLSGARVGAGNKGSQEELVRALRGEPLESLPPYWRNKDPE